MEYQILFSDTATALAAEVQSRLKEGWTLFGYPFVGNGVFYQAMTKSI